MNTTTTHLFCLRAVASRAARKARACARRFYANQHRLTSAARLTLLATLQRLAFRAEVAKYKHFDAACEAQRHGLSRLHLAGAAGEMEVSHVLAA